MNLAMPFSATKSRHDIIKILRQMLRIIWSVACIAGGSFAIEKVTVIYPSISSVLLPGYFILLLAILYIGHLLIDAIDNRQPIYVESTLNETKSIAVLATPPSRNTGWALATFATVLVTLTPIQSHLSVRVRGAIERQESQLNVPQQSYFIGSN